MKITFFGGVEEVTGSRYLVENNKTKVLVDCGLFQGEGSHESNQDKFPIEPSSIDAVVITHAHIDHTGYIPALVKKGFKGKVYCSKATYALCAIMLLDSGALQEEDAQRKNEEHGSNIKPLYTLDDAKRSLQSFQTVDYDTEISIDSLTVTLIRSGHILGSSFVIISDGERTITFSGDLGRPEQNIMKTPPHLQHTDYLVLESTYGNRLHKEGDPIKALGEVVKSTVAKGGKLIIPAFAVGRTQMILYFLYKLREENVIPKMPIFLDSPMAISVTDLYCTFKDEHQLSPETCNDAFDIATYTRSVKESKKINHVKGPAIIIAGSGMVTGGRVLEHLKHFVSDAKNTVLIVGFQAKGTEGRALVEGAEEITIDDKKYTVRADVKTINTLSAHADYGEILEWLSYFEKPIKKIFLTHGEIEAAEPLKKKIEEQFGWPVVIPKYSQSFDLD